MTWSDRLAIGIPKIDEQHRMLFKMADDYRRALNEGRGERVYPIVLRMLRDYADAHFRFEDTCMHRYQCPAAPMNSEAHGQFLAQLLVFDARLQTTGFTPADARELLDYVDGWLAQHIGSIDVQLKACVDRAGH